MSRPPLHIGLVAPPWLAVPPTAYGGTELAIDALAAGLTSAGHEVVVFTIGTSTAQVARQHLFAEVDPNRMGTTIIELRHVCAAYDLFADESVGIDIVHDHTLAGPFVAAGVTDLPIVTTNHGPFDDDFSDLYRRLADRVPVIAISHDQASRAPVDVPIAGVIHHGLRTDRYPFGFGGEDVVFLGRMAPDKGVDVAIRVARAAGLRLLIAARMRGPAERAYFDSTVRPELGEDVVYVGEVDFDRKVALLSRARALLNPIRWPEPFGLVMAESLACGTPVVGCPEGAAPEIVDDGVTGFLTRSEPDLVTALTHAGDLDRRACRRAVLARFTAERMARDHVELYRAVIEGRPGRAERKLASV